MNSINGKYTKTFDLTVVEDSPVDISDYLILDTEGDLTVNRATLGLIDPLTVIDIPSEMYDVNGDLRTVTSIGKNITSSSEASTSLFRAYTSLESITIPDSVTTIGIYCFALCSKLETVVMGNNVSSIGIECFRSCTSLTNFELPPLLEILPENLFRLCGALSLIIHSNIKTINDTCFYAWASSQTIIFEDYDAITFSTNAMQDCDANIVKL